MEKILVTGHKCPDTDTICSAIVMAKVQSEIRNEECEAFRLGEINKETEYALNYFKVEEPQLIEKVEEGQRVIDVVKKAGGFTINADNRVNNLSKKITDEMVIIIYSKEEVREFEKTKEQEEVVQNICTKDITNDACITKENSKNEKKTGDSSAKKEEAQDKKLVSINEGTLEELMTLSGVGESKAKAIIEYRTKKKFETIEEIKQVSGIGEALFEKIKENITI